MAIKLFSETKSARPSSATRHSFSSARDLARSTVDDPPTQRTASESAASSTARTGSCSASSRNVSAWSPSTPRENHSRVWSRYTTVSLHASG